MKRIILFMLLFTGVAVFSGCNLLAEHPQNDYDLFDTTEYVRNDEFEDGNAFTNVNDRGFNDQRNTFQNFAMNAGEFLANDGKAVSKRGNYGYSDYNYHGQLNTYYNGVPTKSYETGHDNVIAQKIVDRVEHIPNVKNVHAIIDGDQILVVIDTDHINNKKVKDEVERVVSGMSNGRKVIVITEHEYNRKK